MRKTITALITASMLSLGLGLNGAIAADRLNVVYHVSDEDKVAFVLNNMQNHIDGVGGAENIHVVLVSHGPAVKRFIDIEAIDQVRGAVTKLQQQGVEFDACANTLTALGIQPDELLADFVIAEKGGVTRIGELQSQGYVYIRP
jgi:intracellular sulfur oxidation DsrE/DsrF family protein